MLQMKVNAVRLFNVARVDVRVELAVTSPNPFDSFCLERDQDLEFLFGGS